MTAAAALLAGSRLLAAEMQGVAPTAAYKGAAESVTNSTTLQNDDALYLSLPADSTWVWVCWLIGQGAANGSGDLKVTWTWPTGATGSWSALGYGVSGATPNLDAARNSSGAAAVPLGLNGTTLASAILLGSLVVGATAGTLQMEWAQNTGNATASQIMAGSWLAAWQVA